MNVRVALAALLLFAPLAAEESLPPLHETELSEFDLAALQAGEWVEHEMTGPQWPAKAGKKVARRMSCVKVEGPVVRVEVTWRNAAPVYDGLVLVYEADRETRKIRRAWSGKAGGA